MNPRRLNLMLCVKNWKRKYNPKIERRTMTPKQLVKRLKRGEKWMVDEKHDVSASDWIEDATETN